MRWVSIAAIGVAALALAASLSGATFPGTNGLLAYDAKVGKHYQLFTSNADGSRAKQLTEFTDSDALWAAWSPNGKQIAFERDVYTGVSVNHAAIYTMNADGSGLRSLTPTGLNGAPSWSPNGKLIVFSTLQFGKQATISVIAANGGRVRTLRATPLPCKRCYDIVLGSATFSPDGKRIAFVWHNRAVAAIFTTNASGGGLKQVSAWKKGGVADKIDWSPDGSRIASPPRDSATFPGSPRTSTACGRTGRALSSSPTAAAARPTMGSTPGRRTERRSRS
jgi:Tol biopolymer transport system component